MMQTGGGGNPILVCENGPVEVKRARIVFSTREGRHSTPLYFYALLRCR